ncbi:hypothetical protein [Aestuariibius sp. HNIBRBA575]|uniref:hypothetical protein n=1 Tax=Aestuariibius sp. HNIBRBA575 TaxID=3233343 RepID=UPI0034A50DB0
MRSGLLGLYSAKNPRNKPRPIWVDEGIQTPTEMVVDRGHIYVVDQTQLHQISLATGDVVHSYKSVTAYSLNDVDVTLDGQIFVSELQG